MKLVLSRKGFDSAAGGAPSPVLPDGRMLSLPIPEPSTLQGVGTPYGSLRIDKGRSYLDVMTELGYRHPDEGRGAHLDPDLVRGALPRRAGWRPAFGQCSAAQAHLENERVDVGDLFLFFGLFRKTVWREGRLAWAPGSRRVHAIFGYLEIGEKVPIGQSLRPGLGWARRHPHIRDPDRPRNTVYIAAEKLSLDPALPGAGTFQWNDNLCLSAPCAPASVWRLPDCFGPPDSKKLSYHGKADRWQPNSDGTWRLESVGRGQEFVIEADAEIRAWARSLIVEGSRTGERVNSKLRPSRGRQR